jgi:hypothetical protein
MDKKTQMQIDQLEGRKKMSLALGGVGVLLLLLGVVDAVGVLDVPYLHGLTLILGGLAGVGKAAWDMRKANQGLEMLR